MAAISAIQIHLEMFCILIRHEISLKVDMLSRMWTTTCPTKKGGHKNNHVYWREDSRAEISPGHLLLFPKIKNNETRPVHVCARLFIT